MTLQETIVIDFNLEGSSADFIAVPQLDDDRNTNVSGEAVSNFSPGDTIYLWLHLSSNVVVTEVVATYGSVYSQGFTTKDMTDQVFFTNREVGDPTVYESSVIPSAYSMVYYGREGTPTANRGDFGILTLTGDDFSNVPYIADILNVFPVQLFSIETDGFDQNAGDVFPLGVVFYLAEV